MASKSTRSRVAGKSRNDSREERRSARARVRSAQERERSAQALDPSAHAQDPSAQVQDRAELQEQAGQPLDHQGLSPETKKKLEAEVAEATEQEGTSDEIPDPP